MNDGQVQECIDYLRFSMELEGSSLAEGTEEVLRSVLEGERTVVEVHADFIRKEGLEVAYETGYDEMSNYPDSKCLVNYFNIRDKKVLRPIEHFLVNLRTVELFMDPMPGRPTFSLLKEIHSRLFGDIYPSAGMIRTVEASKRKDFCRPQFIEKAADELFTRLQTLMSEQKIYMRPDLSRDAVAKLLSTNRTYLSEAISRYTGLSFVYYVNSFRIDAAVRILSDPNDETPIKALVHELGFHSMSTFYRLFQAAKGVPPSQFREQRKRHA